MLYYHQAIRESEVTRELIYLREWLIHHYGSDDCTCDYTVQVDDELLPRTWILTRHDPECRINHNTTE